MYVCVCVCVLLWLHLVYEVNFCLHAGLVIMVCSVRSKTKVNKTHARWFTHSLSHTQFGTVGLLWGRVDFRCFSINHQVCEMAGINLFC